MCLRVTLLNQTWSVIITISASLYIYWILFSVAKRAWHQPNAINTNVYSYTHTYTCIYKNVYMHTYLLKYTYVIACFITRTIMNKAYSLSSSGIRPKVELLRHLLPAAVYQTKETSLQCLISFLSWSNDKTFQIIPFQRLCSASWKRTPIAPWAIPLA